MTIFPAIALALASSTPSLFPVISASEHRFHFGDGSRAKVDLEIKTPAGVVAYRIACRTAPSRLRGEREFAGPFDCHLFEPGREEAEPNLLLEVPGDAAFYGRGRFIAEDLRRGSPRGADGGGPGPTRVIRLRKMKIVLEAYNARVFIDPKDRDSRIERFDFRVAITPDPSATNAYLYPPTAKRRYGDIR